MKLVIYVFSILVMLTGCATVSKPPATVEAPYNKAAMEEAQKAALSVPETKVLKRKIAIGRFSNETRYGRTLFRDGDLDPLGKQASDMLASRLVSSQKFLVFERPDIEKIQREQINEVFFLGLGSTSGLCKGFADPANPGKYIGEANVQFNPDPANAALDALGLDKKDSSGFRLLPGGDRLTLRLPAVVAAFEDYVGISEMIAEQWKKNLGIFVEVQGLERSLNQERAEGNELMLQIWESSGRDAVLITPTHLLPVAGALFTDVLGARWFDGRDPSREPVSEFIKEQQVLYAEGISTSDPAVYLANAQRVVEINCEMVNPITTVMNKPTYVAIIKNNVRNIPNPLPFSYHAQTSGNGFPETWWLDE